jgi:hypothetical protein
MAQKLMLRAYVYARARKYEELAQYFSRLRLRFLCTVQVQANPLEHKLAEGT